MEFSFINRNWFYLDNGTSTIKEWGIFFGLSDYVRQIGMKSQSKYQQIETD